MKMIQNNYLNIIHGNNFGPNSKLKLKSKMIFYYVMKHKIINRDCILFFYICANYNYINNNYIYTIY